MKLLALRNMVKRRLSLWSKAYDPRLSNSDQALSEDMPNDSRQNLPANVATVRETQWAYICIDKIVKTVSGLSMRFFKGRGADAQLLEEHWIKDLLKRPNPEDTHRELWQDTTGFMLSTGNAFWALDQVSQVTGRPVPGVTTLWTLPAHRIEIIPTKNDPTKRISHYNAVSNLGARVRYETNEIVQFKNFNLENQYWGMGPLTVAMNLMQTDYFARKHNRLFFKNGASPGIYLKTDRQYDKDADERIRENLKQNTEGVLNSFKTMIGWNGLEPVDLKKNPKDLDFLNLIKLNREEIIALFGVPPAVVGLFEFANYANAMMQKKEFWLETILPMLATFETRLNEHVFPRWTDEEIWFQFDLTKVPALQEDLLGKAKRNTMLVSGGIMTPNEARLEHNLEPLDSGNDLKQPTAPFAPTAEDDKGLSTKGLSTKGFDPKSEGWFEKDINRRRFESQFLSEMKAYFNGLQSRLIKNLSNFPDDYTLDPTNIDQLYSELIEQKILEDATLPIYEKSIELSGQNAVDEVSPKKSLSKQGEFDIEGVFDVTNPEVAQWIEARVAMMVTAVSDTTQKRIRALIAEGAEKGWSIKQVAEELSDINRSIFNSTRALMIAQTEMGAATNAGAMMGYGQSGVVDQKEWLTARDSEVRDSHLEVEAQGPIGFGDTFSNGLKFPLDPQGPPEEVINCRCTVAPVISDAEEV